MGCGYSKKCKESKISSQIIDRVIPNLNRSKSNLTVNGTMSRINTVRVSACLNIKIQEENHKICGKNLNLTGTQAYITSFEYSKDFIFIRDLYSNYLSAQSFFQHQVHEACFSSFKIEYGLFILLISLKANSSAQVCIKLDSPYLETKGNLNPESKTIHDSWENYLKNLEKIEENKEKIKKSLKKLETFIVTLEDTLEHSQRPGKIEKAIRLCESAVEIGSNLLTGVEKMLVDVKEFMKRIHSNSAELDSFVDRAKEMKVFSGEQIVHSLFGN